MTNPFCQTSAGPNDCCFFPEISASFLSLNIAEARQMLSTASASVFLSFLFWTALRQCLFHGVVAALQEGIPEQTGPTWSKQATWPKSLEYASFLDKECKSDPRIVFQGTSGSRKGAPSKPLLDTKYLVHVPSPADIGVWCCHCISSNVKQERTHNRLFQGTKKTVPLVNHAFARGTPAIFVIFVVSRGLSS